MAHNPAYLPVHSLRQKNWQEHALPFTADCVSPWLVFCLSQFEILNEPYASEEEALGLSCNHAVPVAELSHAA